MLRKIRESVVKIQMVNLLCVVNALGIVSTQSLSGNEGPSPQILMGKARLFRAGATSLAISKDGNTIYFPERHTFLMTTRLRGGNWDKPVPVPFTLEFSQGDPCFSKDGKHLYFWSNRPIDPKSTTPGVRNLWVCEMLKQGWSNPKILDIPRVDDLASRVFPSVTGSGSIYFSSQNKSLGKRDIFYSKRASDSFSIPENLGPPINTIADEFDASISSDERVLVFSRGRETVGCDLYVSRRKNGTWGDPEKLGPEVNFGLGAYCPTWSPDGQWLYFTSAGEGGFEPGIYRISVSILDSDSRNLKLKARLFGKGRISRSGAFGLTLSPDGKLACFAETHSFIMESRLVNGIWTQPKPLPFTRQGFNIDPSLSPDGSTLWFVSNLPGPGRVSRGEYDASIWRVRKQKSGWGKPHCLGNLLNDKMACFVSSPSITSDGKIYFSGILGNGSRNSKIYMAEDKANKYEIKEIVNSNQVVNDEASVAINAIGNMMIFSSNQSGGFGGSDLYLRRRDQNGNWTLPVNLGPDVNSQGDESNPFIRSDDSLIFFFSNRDKVPGIYVVSTPR